MPKPIIMQVLPSLNSGGVERVTLDTAGFLASIDKEIPTYVVSSGGGLVPKLEQRGVQHIQLPVATKNPFKIIVNAFRLANLVKKLKVNLLHVRSRAPAWSVLLASKISGVPYVATYHGAYRSGNFLKNLYNSAMVRGRCVIAISDFVRDLISKEHGKLKPNIIKIYPGVDAFGALNPSRYTRADIQAQKQAWGIPESAKVLLVIGRITSAKRFDLAIRALARLRDKNSYLVIAGSDQGRVELTQELLNLSESLGVKDRVILVKDFPEIPLAYAVSDLVLFPTSHIETYGRITAEAGAMAKIIIACRVGAVAELIDEGKTGFVIPEADLEALVDRVEKIMALSDDEKLVMERQARQHVETYFSAARMYSETLKLYQEIIAAA